MRTEQTSGEIIWCGTAEEYIASGAVLPGDHEAEAGVARSVAEIIADVRRRGQPALREWTRRLDGADLARFELTRSELTGMAAGVSAELRDAMAAAAARIRSFALIGLGCLRPLLGVDAVTRTITGRLAATEFWCPVGRAGVYVPGGRAPYVSSVLMTAIPAKVAGVDEVVMCTPPGVDGGIAPQMAVAAELAGVDRVFRLGGAQAVAAMALGAGEVPRVDKLAGPGNAYVTEAKRQLFGEVGLDGLAGPSEVVAVSGRPGGERSLADQLLAQAEHDPWACAVGVLLPGTDAGGVLRELAQGLADLPENRAVVARESLLRRGALIRAACLPAAAAIVKRLCPEHLWVDLGRPDLDAVFAAEGARWAGAVFVGPRTSVAYGDYIAGPSHVLPTGRSARWGSPLGPVDFMRRVSVVSLDGQMADELRGAATAIAWAEGFHAHARSMRAMSDDEER